MGYGFWVEFREEELRLDSIFGIPRNYSIREDIPVYETGFNLSSWAHNAIKPILIAPHALGDL